MSDVGAPENNAIEFDPFAGPAIVLSSPSTESQRELWTATQMGDEASLAFNESVAIRLRGALDIEALRVALAAVVARHEALRATFSADGLTMFVGEPAFAEAPLHDWSDLPAADGASRLAALLQRVVGEPFDLLRGPLFRAEVVRLAPDEHVLVLTAHHIVCDGWSFGVIVGELASLYTAQLRGETSPLPPADRFGEYAHAPEFREGSPEMIQAERYWLQQFQGELPVLDLPLDRSRPALKTYASAREDRMLSAALMRRVKEAGAKERASVFASLLAGFGALVHRLCGQDDLVIGIPAAGQAGSGAEHLVGHFVNMLPLRLHVAPSMRFAELLSSARVTTLDAFEHQQISLGRLLASLPLSRDPSRLPLVSVIFNVDRGLTSDAMPFAGLSTELTAVPRSHENFELFLNAVELEDGAFRLECQYNTDLFDGSTIRRWLECYELLLEAAARNTATELSALPVLTPADQKAIALCNDTALALPPQLTVSALLGAQAQQSPLAVAVECEGAAITYGELHARANQMARRLRTLGVRNGVLVGLCLERSIDMIVAVVAVLKAGGGYVPLDPGYPRDRLTFMLDDSDLRVLVTDSRLRNELALQAEHILAIDVEREALTALSPEPLADEVDAATADSTAYVIYTSGSTGKPKGVVVPNRSVVNLLASARHTYALDERDVVLAITTLSFDIAVSEILLPLAVGARIVLATREIAADGLRLSRLLEDAGVTFIDATPATYRLLLAAGWRGSPRLRVVCTGEAMPLDIAEALCDRVARVWNGYGPTETTVWSTIYEVRRPIHRVLIGRPVGNTVVHVLDPLMQQVPIGVKGELFIAGAGVTDGYLHRPELTRERFLEDPFATEPGARMYRTGDIVRLLADGNLECLGRTDNQVKLRGFRIELGEIEDVLMQHGAIAQAAVTVREDRPGDVRLVAYLVAGGAPLSDGEVRAFTKQHLPDYMVPQNYVWLPAMPLTPSGKVDRKALPAPAVSDAASSESFVEPRTDTERLLAGLWSEVLGVGRVSVADDFFALGGHSLLASHLLARLRRDHGVELPFRKIFELPTVAQLAAFLDVAALPAAEPAGMTIPHREGITSAPLTILQERLWLLEEMNPNQRVTHSHAASWRFRGPVDLSMLEAALLDFMRRHESMRTSFRIVDGVRTQVIAPEPVLVLRREDFSALDEEEQRAATSDLFAREQEVPFELDEAPLFRATLVRMGSDDYLLYTLRHGMIWDGWSFDIFIRELTELYAARAAGRAAALPMLPITYADFATWQREWITGPAMARQVEWWREQLAGDAPGVQLTTDRPRNARPTHQGGRVTLAFSASEVEQFKSFARRHDTTLFMLMFSAYATLLHRYTGQDDLLIGSPVQARTRTETENIIGAFVNTVVLRLRVTPATRVAELLRQVREVTLDSFSNQEMPFELLGGKLPQVRVLFSMQDARERPNRMGDVVVEQVHVPERAAANDLMLWMMERTNGLIAVLNFDTELFDRATTERMLVQLRTVLFSFLQDDTRAIGAVELLPATERAEILQHQPAPAPTQLAYGQFERKALNAPHAIALVAGGQSLRYGALLDRSTKVAAALATLGLAPGAPVGVCLGNDRAIGVLAVMQAGHAVVLLDPEASSAYLESMIADGPLAAVLADSETVDQFDRAGDVAVLVVDAVYDTGLADAARRPHQVVPSAAAVVLASPGLDGVRARHSLDHAGVAGVLNDVRSRLAVTADDVIVSGLPAWADAAALELLLPLTTGARLVVAGEETLADATKLAELLRVSFATMMVAPLSTWRALAAVDWHGGPAFRAVVVGAPSAATELLPLAERVGHVYGIAGSPEAGIWFAAHEVMHLEPRAVLGSPLDGAQMVVLDDTMAPQPIGVPGDLYVGGRLSAEVEPRAISVAGVSPARLYRTGDRARRLADGTFELLAGVDSHAWVEGSRVPLEVIEAALRAHPSVSDAAVASHRDPTGIPTLVAYVVRPAGAPATDTELRMALRRRLPRHMLPQLIVSAGELPISADGTLDRTRLVSPFAATASTRALVGPRTEAERHMARVWAEALDVESVGVHDNFFDLGGSSLLCFRVIESLHRETGVRLNPRVFLLGTLEQAAAQLQGDSGPAADGSERTNAAPAAADASNGVIGKLRGLMGARR